jgi:hypothetical protein
VQKAFVRRLCADGSCNGGARVLRLQCPQNSIPVAFSISLNALCFRTETGGDAVTTERLDRRLSAIVAADVAGYSRLMGADEEGTLGQLRAHGPQGKVIRTSFVESVVQVKDSFSRHRSAI